MSSLHIYPLLCRGHPWRVRLAKQETLTPLGHLVSPLVCRGPWMSTVVLYCQCISFFFVILHSISFLKSYGFYFAKGGGIFTKIARSRKRLKLTQHENYSIICQLTVKVQFSLVPFIYILYKVPFIYILYIPWQTVLQSCRRRPAWDEVLCCYPIWSNERCEVFKHEHWNLCDFPTLCDLFVRDAGV